MENEKDQGCDSSSGEMLSCPSKEDSIVSSSDSSSHEQDDEKMHKIDLTLRKKKLAERLDRFLALYCKWTSNSLLTERGLKLFQWSTWFLSQITKDKYKTLSPSLRKLYSELSMMRYVLRLYGIPTAIEGIRTDSWSGGNWKDTRIAKCANICAWSMLIYYPLEHVAYFQWKMPKVLNKIDGNKLSAWSCRFWLVFIMSEMYACILKDREMKLELDQLSSEKKPNSDMESETTSLIKAIDMNRLQIVRDVLFTAPCINWALDNWATNPWLSENWCNGLSLAEAVVCMHQSIKSLIG